jgi:hypothetical protein
VRARRRLAVLLIGALAAVPAPAAAQSYSGKTSPHAGSVEIGGGVVWIGGYDAGTRDAIESPNSSTGGAPLTLFSSSSRVASVGGVDAHLGVYLSPHISGEGLFQFSRPNLRTSLKSDFENAAPVEAVGVISTYLLGGSVLYHFGAGRVVPFVSGGGGYLRQLDEDNTDVVSGTELHGGGGVKIWFGTGGGLGVRFDAQVSSRSKSAGFEQTRRLLPQVGGGIVYVF